MDAPSHNAARRPWAALLLVFFLIVYVGGYFVLSDLFQPVVSGVPLVPLRRSVDYGWMTTAYKPLRIIESTVRGKEVRFVLP